MPHFPSIPNLERLGLFRRFPGRGILPLLEYHDAPCTGMADAQAVHDAGFSEKALFDVT